MALIRYGAEVVLRHKNTGLFLNSPGKPYTHPGTSGQDQVTCSPASRPTACWIVKPPHGYPEGYMYGEPIRQGVMVRLENTASQKNLHSHGKMSPITKQAEVTCYQTRERGDMNDNWKVEFQGHECLETDSPFRLVHVATNKALHSHAHSDKLLTSGEQEVTAYPRRDNNDLWTVSAVYGPLLPLGLAVGDKTRSWVSVLNLVGSIASITGITLLLLGTTLSTVSFARVVSITLCSSLFLGVITAMFLGLCGAQRRLRLSARSRAWIAVMWMVLTPIGVGVSLYLWQALTRFGSAEIEALLTQLFTRR